MEIELLEDNPQAAHIVAQWYFDEWVSDPSRFTLEIMEARVSTYTDRQTAPMLVLAKDNGLVVGAAELKIREMDIYPQYEYWLGGVYVEENARGKGIASLLAGKVYFPADNCLKVRTFCPEILPSLGWHVIFSR